VNDKQFAMEMQVTHTDSEGHLMVLAVLFEIGLTQNRFLDSLGWDNLPGHPRFVTERRQAKRDDEAAAIEALSAGVYHAQARAPPAETESVLSTHVRKDPIDLLSAMPTDRSYYTYRGSLTKPPCTEGLIWVILEQRARMSNEQLHKFRFGSMSTHFANARFPMPVGFRGVRRNADPVDELTELPWDYGTKGPSAWPFIGYPTCAGDSNSVSQSPIDIAAKDVSVFTNNELNIKFRVIPAGGVSIRNDGHAIVVEGLVGSVVFEKTEFVLQRIHIRRGEHRLDGRAFPCELHFELEDIAKGVLIAAVLFEVGARNQWLDALQVSKWSSLTTKSKKETTAQPFSATWLLPNQGASKSGYFSYDGSLTYPPCSQRVTWVVLAEINTLASFQLDSMFPTTFGTQNFRPVQPLNGRIVSRLSKVAVPVDPKARVPPMERSRRSTDETDRDWGYSFAKGPLKWGRIYANCRSDAQSPVNIVPCQAATNDANRLVRRWSSQPDGLVTNNGAAIQASLTWTRTYGT
jgi:carbonic anhydrase